ncbi:MAG: GNAT family N-acetyltransferase, partial [Anaerolineales bacterium]|nr:GNAT family N-acetyltransferase [Anaerolineales bacterium]
MLFARQQTLRAALGRDKTAIIDLMHSAPRVHVHLDWRPAEDWLGEQPFVVLERGDRLVAALACPPDPDGLAWIRLLATHETGATDSWWPRLWAAARESLEAQGVRYAASLSLETWSARLLEATGFTTDHAIVALARSRRSTLAESERLVSARIRPADRDDYSAIVDVDQSAFPEPWNLSERMLRLALEQGENVSVAEQGGRVVGYQLTTPSHAGAHLARLAVRPESQGYGIGRALVARLIVEDQRRGHGELTVNTQEDNH